MGGHETQERAGIGYLLSRSTAVSRRLKKSGMAEVTRDQLGICGAPKGSCSNSSHAALIPFTKVSTATASWCRSNCSPSISLSWLY